MASALPLTRHRLSVDQFQEMGRVGILARDSRVELIDGALIDMAPIGSRHAGLVNLLSMTFARGSGNLVVWTQSPIVLPPYSEPQPDVALLAPSANGYASALPTAADILLVVEVAESTLRYDRTVKLPLYAGHGIPEVWIVNLVDRCLEAFREPDANGYRVTQVLATGDTAIPAALPSMRIPLGTLFPD